MSDKKKPDFIKVTTPKFRVSFANVFRAKQINNSGDPKFSMSMLFDKEAQETDAYKAMQKAAAQAQHGKWGNNPPKKRRNPFKCGAEKAEEGYDGYGDGVFFVSATSKMIPGLINQKHEDIISEDDFYSGCYARATLLAFAYDTAGNRGTSFLLCNIQKLEDGEPLGNKRSAQDDFDVLDNDDSEFELGGDVSDSEFDLG